MGAASPAPWLAIADSLVVPQRTAGRHHFAAGQVCQKLHFARVNRSSSRKPLVGLGQPQCHR